MKLDISKRLKTLLEHLTPIRVIVTAALIAFFWFLVLGDQGVYQLQRLMEMKSGLLAEQQEINDDIDRLTHEKQLLQEPKRLEPIVRAELGYIRPGEVLFEEKAQIKSTQ